MCICPYLFIFICKITRCGKIVFCAAANDK